MFFSRPVAAIPAHRDLLLAREFAGLDARGLADLPLAPIAGPMLVTGSSGRLGGLLVARRRGLPTRGLDRRPGDTTDVTGSILDAPLVADAMRGVDAVVHGAALHAPDVGRSSEAAFRAVNVDGTEHLLAAARWAGVRRFVFVSSTSVYGCAARSGTVPLLVTEDLRPNPLDIYDETKLQAERRVLDADGDFPDGTVVLRIGRFAAEPASLRAWYRFHRGLAAVDAAAALDRAAVSGAGGVFNIVARTRLTSVHPTELASDPLAVLERLYPAIRFGAHWRAVADRGIDRIYDGAKAADRLGFVTRFDTIRWQERAERLARRPVDRRDHEAAA